MPIKPIRAVKVIHRGRVKYRIIVPSDLRGAVGQRTIWFDGRQKEKAETEAARLQSQRDDVAKSLLHLPKSEQAALLQCFIRSGRNTALIVESLDYFLAIRPSHQIKIKTLVEQCCKSKETSGKSHHYVKCLHSALEQFSRGRGERFAHEILPADVEGFINGNPKWSRTTRRNYLKEVRTMFSYAVKNGYCVSNPAAKVERPVVDDDEPALYTPAEVRTIMERALKEDPGLVRFFAVRMFGGMRKSEAVKLTDENFKPKYVDLGFVRNKTGRRLVAINDAMRSWIDAAKPGPLTNLQKRERKILRGIGKRNGFRHTFCTYHYAIHGPAATAREAGHSEAILNQNYRELGSIEDAQEFWKIVPFR